MANRKFASMIGVTDRSAVKRIAALLSLVMTVEIATVPLAQAAVLVHPAPMATTSAVTGPVLPASRVTETDFVAPFRLPSSIGTTVEVHSPVAAGRLIYHVQDVHGNVAAQTNLSEIVARLSAYAEAQGKSLVVAVEGAAGTIDTDEISALSDDKAKDAVSAGLIRSGFLMGEERAAIINKPGRVKIVGVESPALYNRNVLARERSAQSRERVLATVREIKSQLDTLKEHNFSPLLTTLEKNRVAVEEGRMEMGDYLVFLSRTNPALVKKSPMVSRMIAVGELEKKIDFAAVEKEGRLLVEELVRQKDDKDVERIMKDAVALREGRISPLAYYKSLLAQSGKIYPTLEQYTAYLSAAEQVNPDALFVELETLETEMAKDLVRHPLAYELYKDVRWIERQERFFSLNMVPQEWQAQKNVNVADIYATHADIRAFVDEQVGALGYKFATPPFSMADLKVAVRGAGDFYRAAESRDSEMVANLRKTLDKYGKDGAIVAFVAGGFHTPGLTRELRAHGLAYEVIRPQIEAGVQLSQDVNYPTYAPQARLLSDRSQTDFLRPATNLTPEGVAFVKSQIQTPSPRSSYPARLTRPQIAYLTIIGAFFSLGAGNADGMSSWTAAGIAALVIGIVVTGIIVFRRPIMAALRSLRPTRNAVPDVSEDSAITLGANDQRQAVPGPVNPAKPGPAEIVATVQKSAQLFGLTTEADLSDILYIGVQYSQYLGDRHNLTMITSFNGNVDPAGLTPGNPAGADFQVSAIQPDQTFPLLGVIDLEKDVAKRAPDAPAVKAKVVVNALDGGIGENYTRVEYLKRRFFKILGAKGTDLAHKVTVTQTERDGRQNQVVREVSVAEMKLLQLLSKRRSFSGLTFEPLVNKESEGSYRNLLNQTFLGDALDDRVPAGEKRTYAQVFKAAGIDLSSHLQKDLFGVKADDLTLPTQKEGVPAQPGGHAQLGFWFFIEALKGAQEAVASGVKKLIPSVRVFYNGDNLNSRPNDDIIQHMIDNNHVAYMVATPAEAIDKKGGKIGVRWVNVRGKWIPVPDMMEAAQAKAALQIEPFYEAGQPGGIGVPGRQLFNTNQLYINEELLGQILLDLKNLLRVRLGTDDEMRLDFELAKIFGPTMIPKDAKNGYFPIDGAIGSVLLNLNAYFMLNGDDADITNILRKRGIDQILHIVNGPRMEAFTPEKTPADRINEDGRFSIDSAKPDFEKNKWIFIDRNPGQPMPDIDVRGTISGPVTANWKKDAGDWADLGDIQALIPGLDTRKVTYLGLHGMPVQFPAGTEFHGKVLVSNYAKIGTNGSGRIDLRNYRNQIEDTDPELAELVPSPAHSEVDYAYSFSNAHVIIDEQGGLHVLPFGQDLPKQNFTPTLSILGGVALIAIGAFGAIDHSLYFGLIAILGLLPAFIGVLAAIVSGPQSNRPTGDTDIHALVDNPAYSQTVVRKVIELAKAARPEGASEPVRVVVQKGIVANVKGGVLYVGRDLLRNPAAGRTPSSVERLISFARAIVLHFALYHELQHTRGVRSELLAYPLGFVAAVLPFLFGNSTPLPGDTTYSERGLTFLTQRYGMNGRLFYQGLVALFARLKNVRTNADVPAYIAIDADSISQFAAAPEDGKDLSESDEGFVTLVSKLHVSAAGSEAANAEVAIYTSNLTDTDRLARIETMVRKANAANTGVRFNLVRLTAPAASAAALFGPSAKNVNATNTVLLTEGDAALDGATLKKILGVPHLALATFAYSRYASGDEALTELMSLFNLLVKDFAMQPTLTNTITTQIIAAMQA